MEDVVELSTPFGDLAAGITFGMSIMVRTTLRMTWNFTAYDRYLQDPAISSTTPVRSDK